MDHDSDADCAAIERVLAGDASPEERQRVKRWAEQDAANAALLRQLEAAWLAQRASGSGYDSTAAWTKVQARIRAGAPPLHTADAHVGAPLSYVSSRTRPSRRTRAVALRWAAAVALLLGGSAVVLRETGPLARAGAQLMATEVSTTIGQRATVRLGDGSVVTLGPQSTVMEAPGGGRERRIVLNGTAHFDVVRDEERPFVVRVGSAETRVLGTSFGVRGYADSPLEVVVETGRVSVRADSTHEGIVLDPGQLATVARDGSVSVRSGVDVALRLSWREGRLSFDGAPLSVVAADIERWYGIDVTIADATLTEYPLTATFAGASVDDVLDVTSRSLGIRHSFDGRTAVFRP